MPTLMENMTLSQGKALAIAPKCVSLLSLIGSSLIVRDILRARRRQAKSIVYHRLVMGMSICDIIASSAWFLTTWPIPKDDPFSTYGAMGTQATCTAQGFFTQLSIATPFYNGFLALYYYLVVRCGWSELRLSKIEVYMHRWAILFAITTSSVAASTKSLNPIGWDCWLSAVPLGCEESWRHGGKTTCTRGDNATLYQWLFFYVPLWIIFVFIVACMWRMHRHVLAIEKKSARWSIHPEPSVLSGETVNPAIKLGVSRQVMKQSRLYVAAFLSVWAFPTILRIHEQTNDSLYYYLVLLSAVFIPSQGIWNVIVYFRPRYIKILDQRRKKEKRQAIRARLLQYQKLRLHQELAKQQHKRAVEKYDTHGDINEDASGHQGAPSSTVLTGSGFSEYVASPVRRNPRLFADSSLANHEVDTPYDYEEWSDYMSFYSNASFQSEKEDSQSLNVSECCRSTGGLNPFSPTRRSQYSMHMSHYNNSDIGLSQQFSRRRDHESMHASDLDRSAILSSQASSSRTGQESLHASKLFKNSSSRNQESIHAGDFGNSGIGLSQASPRRRNRMRDIFAQSMEIFIDDLRQVLEKGDNGIGAGLNLDTDLDHDDDAGSVSFDNGLLLRIEEGAGLEPALSAPEGSYGPTYGAPFGHDGLPLFNTDDGKKTMPELGDLDGPDDAPRDGTLLVSDDGTTIGRDVRAGLGLTSVQFDEPGDSPADGALLCLSDGPMLGADSGEPEMKHCERDGAEDAKMRCDSCGLDDDVDVNNGDGLMLGVEDRPIRSLVFGALNGTNDCSADVAQFNPNDLPLAYDGAEMGPTLREHEESPERGELFGPNDDLAMGPLLLGVERIELGTEIGQLRGRDDGTTDGTVLSPDDAPLHSAGGSAELGLAVNEHDESEQLQLGGLRDNISMDSDDDLLLAAEEGAQVGPVLGELEGMYYDPTDGAPYSPHDVPVADSGGEMLPSPNTLGVGPARDEMSRIEDDKLADLENRLLSPVGRIVDTSRGAPDGSGDDPSDGVLLGPDDTAVLGTNGDRELRIGIALDDHDDSKQGMTRGKLFGVEDDAVIQPNSRLMIVVGEDDELGPVSGALETPGDDLKDGSERDTEQTLV